MADRAVREGDLIGHVKCELRGAVKSLVNDPQLKGSALKPDWINTWGVTVSMKLIVDEKFTIAPSYAFNNTLRNAARIFPNGTVTVPQSQNTAIGFSLAAGATRTETVGFFYSFADLLAEDDNTEPCTKAGGVMIEGDLQIGEFMTRKIVPSTVEGLLSRKDGASPYSVFSYQVSFVLTTSGNVTPTWKLVYLSANPTAPFVNGSRAKTNDLTLTLGPIVVKDGKPSPSESMRDNHLATMIGDAVAAAIRQQP